MAERSKIEKWRIVEEEMVKVKRCLGEREREAQGASEKDVRKRSLIVGRNDRRLSSRHEPTGQIGAGHSAGRRANRGGKTRTAISGE